MLKPVYVKRKWHNLLKSADFGETTYSRNFLDFQPAASFDRVLMNPPFEKLQDVDHVLHAFKFLKPGGRLVAIMGEGAFFRNDSKAQQFRDWLDGMGGVSEQLPQGSFTCSDRPTGVNCRIVTVDAPEEKPQQRMAQLQPQMSLF